jgi:hypothetical protein
MTIDLILLALYGFTAGLYTAWAIADYGNDQPYRWGAFLALAWFIIAVCKVASLA